MVAVSELHLAQALAGAGRIEQAHDMLRRLASLTGSPEDEQVAAAATDMLAELDQAQG